MASAKFRPNEEGVYDEKPSLTPYATAIENVARLVGCCHRTLHCLPGGAVHCHRRSRRSDTFPRANNKYDAITGNYCAGTCGGFVRTPDGTITTYKAEAGSTAALAINSGGTIAGEFGDIGGNVSGFVRTPDAQITAFMIGARQTVGQAINSHGSVAG